MKYRYVLRWFDKTKAEVGSVPLSIPREELRQLFHLDPDDPVVDSYPVTCMSQALEIEESIGNWIDENQFDYFVECEPISRK